MIEREHPDKIILVCDDCGEMLDAEFDRDEFQRMIDHAKTEGWKITPDGEGGFTHTCTDCKGGHDRLAAQRKLLGL